MLYSRPLCRHPPITKTIRNEPQKLSSSAPASVCERREHRYYAKHRYQNRTQLWGQKQLSCGPHLCVCMGGYLPAGMYVYLAWISALVSIFQTCSNALIVAAPCLRFQLECRFFSCTFSTLTYSTGMSVYPYKNWWLWAAVSFIRSLGNQENSIRIRIAVLHTCTHTNNNTDAFKR